MPKHIEYLSEDVYFELEYEYPETFFDTLAEKLKNTRVIADIVIGAQKFRTSKNVALYMLALIKHGGTRFDGRSNPWPGDLADQEVRQKVRKDLRKILGVYYDKCFHSIRGSRVWFENLYPQPVISARADETIAGIPAEVTVANPAPTTTIKAAIRAAAIADYQSRLNGRFSGLGIDKIITDLFPNGQVLLDVQASTGEESSNIQNIIREHSGENLMLIGAGGVGKTTTLVQILHDAYSDNAPENVDVVPIYIELNNTPEYRSGDLDDRCSNYILSRIINLIKKLKENSAPGTVPDVTIDSLREEFSQNNNAQDDNAPEYLLLLDGLNEVSSRWISDITNSVQGLLIQEIRRITDEFSNVRVIITSRTNFNISTQNSKITEISISGVTDETIFNFLENHSKGELVDFVKSQPALLECLHIPLFLIMYCGVAKGENNISTRGAILREFWHVASSNYSQAQVNEARDGNRDMTMHMFQLIVDFVAPALCDEMEKNSAFLIDEDDAIELIKQMLADESEFGLRGKYAKRCFSRYHIVNNAGYPENIQPIAVALSEPERGAPRILRELVNMGILYYDKQCYGVCHHYYRDYFAAVHTVNSFELARFIYTGDKKVDASADLAFKCLESVCATPMSRERAILIGEYLDEDKNTPVQEDDGKWRYTVPTDTPCKRSLIHRVLDIFRDRFKNSVGYGVYNLVNVLKLTRKILAGEDFSDLDFTHGSLNGAKPGLPGLGANLQGAKLRRGALFCEGHTGAITCAQFSPDGTRIVTASRDGTAKIWDTHTGEIRSSLEGHTGCVISATFSPDGAKIVTASADDTAMVWDAHTGKWMFTLKGHTDCINSATFSPDGNTIVTASRDKTAKIWDAHTGELLPSLEGHTDSVRAACFSPDGAKIVTASADGTAMVWDAHTGKWMFTLKGHTDWINSATFSPDGNTIVTASRDKTAKIWDAHTGELLPSLEGHTDSVRAACFSPDGDTIVTASADDTAMVWDAHTGKWMYTLKGHTDWINSATFSPDGDTIVTASDDGTAMVWDAHTGELLPSLKGHADSVYAAYFSPDGAKIVTISFDSTAKVWDAHTGQVLSSLDGHTSLVLSANFSPDGTRIITASDDSSVKIWDAHSDGLLFSLERHPDWVTSATFSPDGTRIVIVLNDRTAQICDANSGKLLSSFEELTLWVTSATFKPYGNIIFLSSGDGAAEILDEETGECLYTLPHHYGLSVFECDMRDLHSDSDLSTDDIATLRQYGAIVE